MVKNQTIDDISLCMPNPLLLTCLTKVQVDKMNIYYGCARLHITSTFALSFSIKFAKTSMTKLEFIECCVQSISSFNVLLWYLKMKVLPLIENYSLNQNIRYKTNLTTKTFDLLYNFNWVLEFLLKQIFNLKKRHLLIC